MGTHSAFGEGSHTRAHTPKQGGVSDGGRYYYPRSVPHVSETLRGRGLKRQTLPLLGLGRGYSRRTQKACGTAMRMMRVAVPRRRGPAGLRDLFRFCRNRDLYIRRSWFSACARHGWYHYPQRALRAAETPDGRLQKRLTCRFLRSGGRSSPHDSYFLANTQNFLLAVPVANAFALWYDKFSKLKFSSSTSWFLSFSYRNPKFHFVVFAVHITFIVIFKVRFS